MSAPYAIGRWKTHRNRTAVLGPQGVSYYSLDVTPTEYLTVKRDGYGGDWIWTVYAKSSNDTWGRALILASGSSPSLRSAKAAAMRGFHNLKGVTHD